MDSSLQININYFFAPSNRLKALKMPNSIKKQWGANAFSSLFILDVTSLITKGPQSL